MSGLKGPFIAVSDHMRLVSEQIAPWVPGEFVTLGTDGFGRSDSREALRRHFEVDAEHVALATLTALARENRFDRSKLPQVIQDLKIDPEQVDPVSA